MSGEVETSQAEVNSKALEGFLAGNRAWKDLRRRSSTSTSSRPPDGTGDGYEDEGSQGIQDPQRIEQGGELYHKQEEKAR
jgi:hypothetical protein